MFDKQRFMNDQVEVKNGSTPWIVDIKPKALF